MFILGKDKLGYINGDLPQPEPNDPSFRRWRTENSVVKGWLIGSMNPSLVSNFIRFPTAKQVWDSIAVTYFDGTDTSQVYDLKRRVNRMKQSGEPIENTTMISKAYGGRLTFVVQTRWFVFMIYKNTILSCKRIGCTPFSMD